MAANSDESLLTPLTVTKSRLRGRVCRTTSSNLRFSTLASGSSRTRTASRRKAAFRVFDSIMVSLARGCAIFNGMAGEPPPDPTSNHTRAESATCLPAATGSISSRSNVSSVGLSKGSAVRLILAFHFASNRKYASSWACPSAVIDTPALPARTDNRSRNSCEVTEGAGRHTLTGRQPRPA